MDAAHRVTELREHLQEHRAIEEMYLFGSRARGTFHEDSDYDIGIVSHDFDDMSFAERQRFIRPLVREVLDDVSLDVVCHTPDEFHEGIEAFLPWCERRHRSHINVCMSGSRALSTTDMLEEITSLRYPHG